MSQTLSTYPFGRLVTDTQITLFSPRDIDSQILVIDTQIVPFSLLVIDSEILAINTQIIHFGSFVIHSQIVPFSPFVIDFQIRVLDNLIVLFNPLAIDAQFVPFSPLAIDTVIISLDDRQRDLFAERVMFKPEDMGVTTSLSLNGRLFITPMEHLDALVSFHMIPEFLPPIHFE